MTDLLQASATELARRIREGETTSRQVVDRHIELAQEWNPSLRAIVHTRFEEARTEADAADERLASEGSEDLPPFFGVPCTIKECFAFEGLPHSSGLLRRKDLIADADAPAVARYKAAGAIPLGTTNISELCMWMESSNPVYGRSSNPYDLRRIVGGSSGGEGAIVGCGASPFGLGSDVGGSIRMPAFFCGVFGHKPSPGIVPNTGQHPLAEGDCRRYLSTGPLCRRAEDLMPLLRVLAGPDGQDQVVASVELQDPERVDLSQLRIIDIPHNGNILHGVSPELRACQRAVVEHFERLGARVERPTLPRLSKSLDIWGAMMHLAAETPFSVHMGDGEKVHCMGELGKLLFGQSQHTLPAVVLGLIEAVSDFPPGRARKFHQMGLDLRAEMLDLLGDDGLLVYPSYPVTAPKHRQPLLRPTRFVYTAILNVLHLGVSQVPLGLDRRGLPLGVQLGAAPGLDHLPIAGAIELARAFGGWIKPPTAES